MRVTLAAIANDGDRLAHEWVKAGVLVVVNRGRHESSFSLPWSPIATPIQIKTGSGGSPSAFSQTSIGRGSYAVGPFDSAVPNLDRAAAADIATGPVRTSSRMPNGFTMFSNESICSGGRSLP